MKRKLFIGIGVLAGIIVFAVIYNSNSSTADDTAMFSEVKFGDFVIAVNTSGELEAKNSIDIIGPTGLREFRIYEIKIEDMVDEGTRVKKGAYVARLDQSQLSDKLKTLTNDLEQSLSKYTQVKLDTALTLRVARDEMINLKFSVDEKQIVVDQSMFEAPATQQKAQIELDKAKRTLEQSKGNYVLKKRKAVAEMQEAAAKMSVNQMAFDKLTEKKKEFTVKAPADGMVIYKKNRWSGTKIATGSNISMWDPAVAQLPDISQMISKTFVNEVDIRVIKKGLDVELGLDAFADKKLTGKVVSVANVGEQKPNSVDKVFQVDILINESDTTLRPTMTTSNNIIASVIPDALFVPLEALRSQGDSITYVVQKSGLSFVKKEVTVGETNADEAIILEGLNQGDMLSLSSNDDLEGEEIIRLKYSVAKLEKAR